MKPDFPDEVTITEPGGSTVDPITGNPIAGDPTSRSTVGNLQRQPYFTPEGQFVRNDWVLLLPAGDPITADAEVIGRGKSFHVDDDPARRRDGAHGWAEAFVAVSLKYISDLPGDS